LLYKSYGGWAGLVKSEYFYLALILSALCWRLAANGTWADLAKSVLPTLSGFSIAAYAIFFAVLDERAREVLRAPAPKLDNRSPLLILASAISHAVVIQLLGIVVAVVFAAKPFPVFCQLHDQAQWLNWTVSAIGLFATMYGIALVLAAVLSIFRILEIRSRIGP
jgi:hypothetical protein